MRYSAGSVADRGLQEELARVESALRGLETDYLGLKEWHAAPGRPFTGMVVLADGTDWDPGSGAGVYVYYGAAWNHLG